MNYLKAYKQLVPGSESQGSHSLEHPHTSSILMPRDTVCFCTPPLCHTLVQTLQEQTFYSIPYSFVFLSGTAVIQLKIKNTSKVPYRSLCIQISITIFMELGLTFKSREWQLPSATKMQHEATRDKGRSTTCTL